MDEIIKIGCPVCGAVLTVKYQPGIESLKVTCPICKTNSQFKEYKRIVDKPNEDDGCTQLGFNPNETNNLTLGKLSVVGLQLSYQLMPGENIIGRQASGSSAHFQIPCPSKRMSREHIIIEVLKVPGKGYVHYARLIKERVNPTYIGKSLLEYGDTVVLNDKDIIKLPDVDVRFEIPDEEGTEI